MHQMSLQKHFYVINKSKEKGLVNMIILPIRWQWSLATCFDVNVCLIKSNLITNACSVICKACYTILYTVTLNETMFLLQ